MQDLSGGGEGVRGRGEFGGGRQSDQRGVVCGRDGGASSNGKEGGQHIPQKTARLRDGGSSLNGARRTLNPQVWLVYLPVTANWLFQPSPHPSIAMLLFEQKKKTSK